MPFTHVPDRGEVINLDSRGAREVEERERKTEKILTSHALPQASNLGVVLIQCKGGIINLNKSSVLMIAHFGHLSYFKRSPF